MLGYGLGLIAAGLAAMAVRARAQGALRRQPRYRPQDARVPAEHAWDIATSLLQSFATSVVIFGIGFVIASFLASPAGGGGRHPSGGSADPARPARASSGRPSRALALIVVIIWPPSGSRQLVLTLLLIVLAAVWLEEVRRKTAREFPGAKKGDWMKSMRKRAREQDQRDGTTHRVRGQGAHR